MTRGHDGGPRGSASDQLPGRSAGRNRPVRDGARGLGLAGVEELGTILGVWAHPDDEAYRSAGLMAAARDAGQRVAVATATRGELGTPDPENWEPPRMAALRAHAQFVA